MTATSPRRLGTWRAQSRPAEVRKELLGVVRPNRIDKELELRAMEHEPVGEVGLVEGRVRGGVRSPRDWLRLVGACLLEADETGWYIVNGSRKAWLWVFMENPPDVVMPNRRHVGSSGTRLWLAAEAKAYGRGAVLAYGGRRAGPLALGMAALSRDPPGRRTNRLARSSGDDEGRAFLHNMVRILVGALSDVARALARAPSRAPSLGSTTTLASRGRRMVSISKR